MYPEYKVQNYKQINTVVKGMVENAQKPFLAS